MRDAAGPRRDRAWGIVKDCLAAQLYGASTMALTDRLVRTGYALDEARTVLDDMRSAGEIELRAGHWVLRSATAAPRRPTP